MDEKEVLSLIAEGENKVVEFKRQLSLTSAKEKAEFIKDIIALANSSPDAAYLLIGIDDDKYVVGIDQLFEEQIQYIAHTYVTPPVDLRCLLVPITAPNLPTVGVIAIKATSKPHKVARATDKLEKDEVFVRRGSVVLKASPEDIIRMYTTPLPSSANARSSIHKEERALRLDRVRLFKYSWDEREEDLAWLKENTDGYELGEVLYWEVEGWESRRNDATVGKMAKPLLDKAIELGYRQPDVYYLRAEANASLSNYRLALEDIDEAINKSRSQDDQYVRYLALKAEILVDMGSFGEAYEILLRGRELNTVELARNLSIVRYNFENGLIQRYALEHEFGSKTDRDLKTLIKILAIWKGRRVREVNKYPSGKIIVKTELNDLEGEIPVILTIVRQILGEALWTSLVNDTEVNLELEFPRIKNQISKKFLS